MSIETVSLVDETDNVIGQKPRKDLSSGDMVRVAMLWIENSKGEVLLQQRSFNKRLAPGQWGPAVAGTVEAHESYLDNILKECQEEIGLTGVELVEAGKRILRGEPYDRMFMFYKAIVDKPAAEFVIQEDEVQQVRWLAKQEILQDLAKNPGKYVVSAVFWQELFYS